MSTTYHFYPNESEAVPLKNYILAQLFISLILIVIFYFFLPNKNPSSIITTVIIAFATRYYFNQHHHRNFTLNEYSTLVIATSLISLGVSLIEPIKRTVALGSFDWLINYLQSGWPFILKMVIIVFIAKIITAMLIYFPYKKQSIR